MWKLNIGASKYYRIFRLINTVGHEDLSDYNTDLSNYTLTVQNIRMLNFKRIIYPKTFFTCKKDSTFP